MILMIYTSFSTFVKVDYEILSKNYKVKKYKYSNTKSVFSHFINQLKIFIWLLSNIYKSQAVYIWFADYHSFLPILLSKLFRKKSFLVLGGYDVTYIPELNYGSINNPIRAFCTKYSIKNATINLTVSEYVLSQAKKMAPSANVKTIYNAVDVKKFQHNNDTKEDIVLTVGIIDSEQRIKLKGIDFFVETAKKMLQYKFIIIGINNKTKRLLGKIPPNLELIEYVPHYDLLEYYQKAKVYCQFSLVESFCLTLAEAMACGCTGVVTDAGALKEVVGNSGFVIPNKSVVETEKIIKQAIELNENGNVDSVERISNEFNVVKRKNMVLEILTKYGIKDNG